MKRFLIVTLLLAVSPSFTNMAHASQVKDPQKVCRTSEGNGWSVRDVKQAITCAAHKWHVPGGPRKAKSVARCESGFNEHNRNPSSSASGVYQFLKGTWASVRRHYSELRHRWNLSRSVVNARANVVLAIRYAHAGGWRPWNCA